MAKWYQLEPGSYTIEVERPKAIKLNIGGIPWGFWLPRSSMRDSHDPWYGQQTIDVKGWWVAENSLWDHVYEMDMDQILNDKGEHVGWDIWKAEEQAIWGEAGPPM